MVTTFSSYFSPVIWFGLDALWLCVGILLLVLVKGKAAVCFFVACLCSLVLSLFNIADSYTYSLGTDSFLSYEEDWHFVVFDFGWAFLYLVMISSMGALVIRAGALAKRNRELESILSQG